MTVAIALRQFSVAEYAKMRDYGLLNEDDHVELIDGEIRQMSPIGSRHMQIVNRLTRLLALSVQTTAIVSVQNPVRLGAYSEPQPDLTVLAWRADEYADEVPSAGAVLLLIEVADSSLDYDRYEKLPRYAAAGVREVWLVDLIHEIVEQHTTPRADHYHKVRICERGDVLQAGQVDALTLTVEQILSRG